MEKCPTRVGPRRACLLQRPSNRQSATRHTTANGRLSLWRAAHVRPLPQASQPGSTRGLFSWRLRHGNSLISVQRLRLPQRDRLSSFNRDHRPPSLTRASTTTSAINGLIDGCRRLPSARSPRAAASPITIRKHTEYTHSIAICPLQPRFQ